jgi:hypothetical protein
MAKNERRTRYSGRDARPEGPGARMESLREAMIRTIRRWVINTGQEEPRRSTKENSF